MGKLTKTYKVPKKTKEQHDFPCSDCNNETNHSIVAAYHFEWSQDFGRHDAQGYTTYQIIQCLGCQGVSFRQVSGDSEDYEHDDEGLIYNETIIYYPNRSLGLKEIETHLLPFNVQNIYRETKLAIENEQNILAGIGIRGLIETVCSDLDALGKNLLEKIEWLHAHSIVTKEGSETLHKLRVIGNEAAHKVKAHTKPQLLLALQIIEHMLEGTYIIPPKVTTVFKPAAHIDDI